MYINLRYYVFVQYKAGIMELPISSCQVTHTHGHMLTRKQAVWFSNVLENSKHQ